MQTNILVRIRGWLPAICVLCVYCHEAFKTQILNGVALSHLEEKWESINACLWNQFPASADPRPVLAFHLPKTPVSIKMLTVSKICALNRESTSNHKNKITLMIFF